MKYNYVFDLTLREKTQKKTDTDREREREILET